VSAGIGFPHARLAVQIQRRRRPIGSTTWSSETVYAITSLPWHRARADLLAEAIRGHWQIEALHWIRDVSFGEDLSQIRTGSGPAVMGGCATSPSAATAWPVTTTSPTPAAAPPDTQTEPSRYSHNRTINYAEALGWPRLIDQLGPSTDELSVDLGPSQAQGTLSLGAGGDHFRALKVKVMGDMQSLSHHRGLRVMANVTPIEREGGELCALGAQAFA